jgi:hypothetical protein
MVRKMSKRAVEEALANSSEAVREAAEAGREMTQEEKARVGQKLRLDQISRAGRQMEARADATGDPFLKAVAAWMLVGKRSAEAAVWRAGEDITVMPDGQFDHLGKVARGYLMQYGDGA